MSSTVKGGDGVVMGGDGVVTGGDGVVTGDGAVWVTGGGLLFLCIITTETTPTNNAITQNSNISN